jgi:3-oxoacyl-[acyl-carrier protein] reductase
MNGRKTAIVTGASRGIGRAVALRLASDGYNIAINYRSSEAEAQALCAEITALGVDARAFQADVSNFEEAAALVKSTIEAFGAVDVLVNNAGITRDRLIAMMSEADFNDVVRVNLNGCFNMTRHAYRPMMKQKSGIIINISSVIGIHGNAGQANYAASKAGIIGLTLSTAKELGGRGIRVNAVAPGYIQTDMTGALNDEQRGKIAERITLGRLGTPEDVAGVVSFLCSENASYITGQVISVDGGMQ